MSNYVEQFLQVNTHSVYKILPIALNVVSWPGWETVCLVP